MPVELKNASVVVVAHDVNLSIFRPPWLRDQKILSDEELDGDVVITPGVVRVPAPSFELLLLPDRIQMRPLVDPLRAQGDVLRVLGGIVSTLPHTPFTGVGLNFDYFVSPDEDVQFRSWNREKFAAPLAIDVPADALDDARYGAYWSHDALGMRLNADFKPLRRPERIEEGVVERTSEEEAMLCKFNFHHDLNQPSVPEVLQVLGRWGEAASLALSMAESAAASRGTE